MPTKFKKATTKRTSSRKVSKPVVYGTKPTPPQRGKRTQKGGYKVTTSSSKKASAKVVVKRVTGKAASKPAPKKVSKVLDVTQVDNKEVAEMHAIGARSEDLWVDTASEDEKSINCDSAGSELTGKYPWNNYSKKYLHGKWKAANKVASELRESKKALSSDVVNLKKDATYWKKEAASNLAVLSKNNNNDDKVRSAKLDLLEEKAKTSKQLAELKEKLAAQKNEFTAALTLKKVELSKVKLDNQIEVNAEKLKAEKLNLANGNLNEKITMMKNALDQLKDKIKDYEKIKVQTIKNKMQLKKQMEQADIR